MLDLHSRESHIDMHIHAAATNQLAVMPMQKPPHQFFNQSAYGGYHSNNSCSSILFELLCSDPLLRGGLIFCTWVQTHILEGSSFWWAKTWFWLGSNNVTFQHCIVIMKFNLHGWTSTCRVSLQIAKYHQTKVTDMYIILQGKGKRENRF